MTLLGNCPSIPLTLLHTHRSVLAVTGDSPLVGRQARVSVTQTVRKELGVHDDGQRK